MKFWLLLLALESASVRCFDWTLLARQLAFLGRQSRRQRLRIGCLLVPPSLLGRLSPEAKRDQGKHSSLKYLKLESILHIADMDMLCKGLGWAR